MTLLVRTSEHLLSLFLSFVWPLSVSLRFPDGRGPELLSSGSLCE